MIINNPTIHQPNVLQSFDPPKKVSQKNEPTSFNRPLLYTLIGIVGVAAVVFSGRYLVPLMSQASSLGGNTQPPTNPPPMPGSSSQTTSPEPNPPAGLSSQPPAPPPANVMGNHNFIQIDWASLEPPESEDCKEWNHQLLQIDQIRQALLREQNQICMTKTMSLQEKLQKNLPAYDPQSPEGKRCEAITKDSIKLFSYETTLRSNKPKHCN